MASKMEEILEQLEQVNNDLGESIKVMPGKWKMEGGKRVKVNKTKINTTQIREAKEFIDSVIKEDINGNSMKTEADVNKVKRAIDIILNTLENMNKNKEIENDPTKKALVDSVVSMVKPVQENLTRRQEAIESYKTNGYNVEEHIYHKKRQLTKLQKVGEKYDKKLDVTLNAECVFTEEFEQYNKVSEKQEKISELKNLYDELKQLNDAKKKETDDAKIREVNANIVKKTNEIDKLQQEYKTNYDNSIEFPTNPDEIKKEGSSKISDLESKVVNEKTEIETTFNNKMRMLSPADKETLEVFCAEFEIEKQDLVGNQDITAVYKMITDKESEFINKKFLNDEKIKKAQESIDSLGKLDKIKQEHEMLEDTLDEDILEENEAKINVKKVVDEELKKANLINSAEIKRKDLRKALKDTVYKGRRFAGILSFFSSINKKRALNKVTNVYAEKASKEYVDNLRSSTKASYEEELEKSETFAKKYQVKGVEMAIKGQGNAQDINTKKRLYEELEK